MGVAWYYYRAVANQGEVRKGWLQAPHKEAFFEGLARQQLYCMHYICYPDWIKGYRPPLKDKQLRLFAVQLGTLLASGIMLRDALILLASKETDKRLVYVFTTLVESVDKGNAFSQAIRDLGRLFPEFFRYMVVCGEDSGRLEEVLGELAQYYEERQVTQEALRNALTYPIFLLVMGVLIVALMLVYVIPMVAETYRTYESLPFMTSCMIAWSDWIRGEASIPCLVAIVGGMVGVCSYMRWRFADKLCKYPYQLPLVKEVAQLMVITQFTQVFEMLYRSGIPLVQSLFYVSDIFRNTYIKGRFRAVAETVEAGHTLADAMHQASFLPEVFVGMLQMGEASGKLEVILAKAHGYYKQALDAKLKTMVKLLEPTLIVLLGIGVGCIALGILQPMYQVMGSVNGL